MGDSLRFVAARPPAVTITLHTAPMCMFRNTVTHLPRQPGRCFFVRAVSSHRKPAKVVGSRSSVWHGLLRHGNKEGQEPKTEKKR